MQLSRRVFFVIGILIVISSVAAWYLYPTRANAAYTLIGR